MYVKVERIKERVEEKEGIPPQQQRLIYSGKQMWVSIMSRFPLQHLQRPIWSPDLVPLRNDEKTAADYKIQGGSVLHLVLALRGGSVLRASSLRLCSPSWVLLSRGASRVPML